MRERVSACEEGEERERERETCTCPLSQRQVTIVCPGPRSLATFKKEMHDIV